MECHIKTLGSGFPQCHYWSNTPMTAATSHAILCWEINSALHALCFVVDYIHGSNERKENFQYLLNL